MCYYYSPEHVACPYDDIVIIIIIIIIIHLNLKSVACNHTLRTDITCPYSSVTTICELISHVPTAL